MNIEQDYTKKVGLAHRKKFAQFFTPPEIADFMAAWLLKKPEIRHVLDPAFGLGAFARALFGQNSSIFLKGIEAEPVIFEEAKQHYRNHENLHLVPGDYLYQDWENSYDGIICNPPYFKFHAYENKKALQELKKRLKVNLTGFTNIYTLFLLKSIYQLKTHGRAAYIVPSEFLNSDYGSHVKQYLIHSGMLRHIIVFDFNRKLFNDALTTSAILLMENAGNQEKVHFHVIDQHADFQHVQSVISEPQNSRSVKSYKTADIDPGVKWRRYYHKQAARAYKNLVPFRQVAQVVRGIATGDNAYFTFSIEKAREHQIPEDFLLPCITKSRDVPRAFFTKSDFEALKQKNLRVFLLNAGKMPNNPHVLDYIKSGKQKGVHKKYLTSRRNPWYILEKRAPSPIWAGVFSRGTLKFVRNEAMISNLTTFHSIYLNTDLFSAIDADLLFAYLQTTIAKAIFSDNLREYGDGLRKFEPNDLNQAMMLDLSLLEPAEIKQIRQLYRAYRKSVLLGAEDEKPIREIEALLQRKYGVK